MSIAALPFRLAGVLLLLLACGVSGTIFCSTPLTKLDINSTYHLSDGTFGTSIAAAGANVIVLFQDPVSGDVQSQFSFDNGASFPKFTRKAFPYSFAKVDLITDTLRVLAVGSFKGEMRTIEYNFGSFVWNNQTEAVLGRAGQIVTGVQCAAKKGLFLCVLSNSPVAVNGGYAVYSYSTSASVKQWVRVVADDAPLTTYRMSIASDGTSFMICGLGSLSKLLMCSYTEDGIQPVRLTATQPFDGAFNANFEVQLTSTGVAGTYVLVYQDGPTTETTVTRDYGATWTFANSIGTNDKIPQFLIYTNKVVAVKSPIPNAQFGPQIGLAWQNNSHPFTWDTPLLFSNGTTQAEGLSIASAHYQDNYHVFYRQAGDGRLMVRSCMPTWPPTASPSVSPKTSHARGGNGQWIAAAAALVVAVLCV
ncbi:hypothetical protein BASA81_001866 [Batrachochytrium salamandrivorans]|nr:hypothetical protein BASA81_001866 [Batrachochytrium salamandrivorans]